MEKKKFGKRKIRKERSSFNGQNMVSKIEKEDQKRDYQNRNIQKFSNIKTKIFPLNKIIQIFNCNR
jgi:hypothetical protein